MPNLYITNNNTKTVMGLTPEKKTTPSLVVTCGTTTYYGSLTTCADWATEPNKIVVTSGSTTYYTMAPALGTKYVNFITPTECKAIDGTVMAKCCAGIAGTADGDKKPFEFKKYDNGIGHHTPYEFGVCGTRTTEPPKTSYCVTALLYDSPDTTITHYELFSPPINHTHDTYIVFDDNFTVDKCLEVNTRHKGVRVCKNYQTSPDIIYTGFDCYYNRCLPYSSRLNYDYLYINGTDNNIERSEVCLTFCATHSYDSLNTCFDVVSRGISYSDICSAYTRNHAAVGIADQWSIGYGTNLEHAHYPTLEGGTAVGCYKVGLTMQWFCINMKCYNNDIDKLPKGTLLWTDCPVSCFNQTCWACFSYNPYNDGNYNDTGKAKPWYNRNDSCPLVYPNILDDIRFCYTAKDYDGLGYRYSSNIDVGDICTYPFECAGKKEGNYTFVPIVNIYHYHPKLENMPYFNAYPCYCSYGVSVAEPGKYIICHK